MASVQIIEAAHFYNPGKRGARGGAAQNDKVWGIAKVGNTLVRFWGRRNGALEFKTEVNGIPHDLVEQKLAKGYERMGPNYRALFVPQLERDMPRQYYSAMSRGQLNTNH